VSRSGFPRVACCVIGCRRGTSRIEPLAEGFVDLETGAERKWICAEHWRRVPKTLKARRRALIRQWRRTVPSGAYWHLKGGSAERIHAVRLTRLIGATWLRCVRAATPGGEEPSVGELPEGLRAELGGIGLL
jgi:hypothetical protein